MNDPLLSIPDELNARLIKILKIANHTYSSESIPCEHHLELKDSTIDLVRMGVLEVIGSSQYAFTFFKISNQMLTSTEQIFLEMLSNYDQFLLPSEITFRSPVEVEGDDMNIKIPVIDDKFNKAGFIDNLDKNLQPFMTVFVESQMFLSFIQDIQEVVNGKDLPEISIFLECHSIFTEEDTSIRMKRKILEDKIVGQGKPSHIIHTDLPIKVRKEPTPSILNLSRRFNLLAPLRPMMMITPRNIMTTPNPSSSKTVSKNTPAIVSNPLGKETNAIKKKPNPRAR